MIVNIHLNTSAKLFQVADARDTLRRVPSFVEGRHQHRRQNRDDRNDHQKLNERKPSQGTPQGSTSRASLR